MSLVGDAGFGAMADHDLAILCGKFAWLSCFAGGDPSSPFHARLANCRAELARRGIHDACALVEDTEAA